MSTFGIAVACRSIIRRRMLRVGLLILAVVIAACVLYPEYLVHTARRHVQAREPERALTMLKYLETMAGPSGESSIVAARAYRRLGQMSEARSRLEQAERLGVAKERVNRELWLCFAQAGMMSQAGPHLGELLLSPGDDGPEICEAYVAGYVALQRYAEASGLLEGWLADFPNDEQAWFFRGRIDAAGDQAANAVKSYERALTLNPDRDDIRLVYADTLVEIRKLEAAKHEYTRLLRSSPDSEGVLRSWSRWLNEAGRIEEAIDVSRRLVDKASNRFEAELQLAELLFQNGHYNEALEILEKLRADTPRNKDVRFLLGSVLRLTGDIEAARQHLEFAMEAEAELAQVTTLVAELQSRPDDLALRLQIARKLLSYGREGEGSQWLQSILAYDAGNIPALEMLVEYHTSNGQSDKASLYRQRLRDARTEAEHSSRLQAQ